MEVHVGENDQAVEAAVGDSVIIALPENGATGYQWSVEPEGDGVVVESNEFAPPDSAAPGASGQRVITLRAKRAGTARVDVRLRRAWETTATEQRELAITVRA
jgi:predicted secreted protein